MIVDTRCTMHEDCRENVDLAERCWQSYLADLNAIRVGDDVMVLGVRVEAADEAGLFEWVWREDARMVGQVVSRYEEPTDGRLAFRIRLAPDRRVTTTGVAAEGLRLLKVDFSIAHLERQP